MSTVRVPVVIDEVNLNTLMTYFETDDPSQAVIQTLKWAVVAGPFAKKVNHVDTEEQQRKPHDDFARKEKAELQQIAAYIFPDAVQDRVEELLDKKREGDIMENEKHELDRLILEVQLKTVEKAKAMAALKSLEEKES